MRPFKFKFLTLTLLCLHCNFNAQDLVSRLKSLPHLSDSVYISNCAEIADEYVNQRKPSIALYYLDSALQRAKKINSPGRIAFVYNYRGNTYNYLNEFNKALEDFEKALDIYKKINYLTGISSVYTNKGNTFFYGGEFQKAENYFKKALEVQLQAPKNEATEANIYNNLGSVCGMLKKYDEAENYFLRVLKLNFKEKDLMSLAYTYNNIGSLYSSQNKCEESLNYLYKAVELKKKYGTKTDLAKTYRNISSVLELMKRNKEALEMDEKSLLLIDTNVYNNALLQLYEGLAELNGKLGNYKRSNYYMEKLVEINEQIFSKEMTERLDEKEMMLSFARTHLKDSLMQANRIEKQNSEIATSNTIRTFLILIVVLISVFSFLLFKRYKISQAQKNEIALQKHLVDEKQEEILASITYAQRIQRSLLPTEKFIDRILKKNRES